MDEQKPGVPTSNGGLPPSAEGTPTEAVVHYHPRTDATTGESPYGAKTVTVAPKGGITRRPPPPPNKPPDDGDGDDDDGMLRMSFMEHLEELRNRIIKALYGLAIAFVFSLLYAYKLWEIIQEPASVALTHLGVIPPRLIMTQPMEGFSIIWVKLPLLCSLFIASPWVLYQAWAFIAPGLYKKEKRWAVPGILCTAGLFITGGLFAYFLAFRYGLEFLLGIGMSNSVQPMVTITEYFDLFVDVTLGVGLVFEMPVLIIFLTLIRLASPRFLLSHSRYAILAIVIIAAVVTPTPDVFNMMLFAVPMTVLYFLGVFVGFLIVLKREGKPLPWLKMILFALGIVAAIAIMVFVMITYFGYKSVPHWPFLVR